MNSDDALKAFVDLTMAVYTITMMKCGEVILDHKGVRLHPESASKIAEIVADARASFEKQATTILSELMKRPITKEELDEVSVAISNT